MDGVQISAVAVLVLVVLVIVFVIGRRHYLARAGAIDVCWRDQFSSDGSGWYLGLGKFDGDDLGLYRSFSLFPAPSRTLRRTELILGVRRSPVSAEEELLPDDAVIHRCRVGHRQFELAMSAEAATGLLAWLESVPPSNHSTGRLRRTG